MHYLPSVAIFILSVLFVVYVVAGYPLLLARLARSANPVRKEWKPRRVSVVIAARNAAHYIGAKLDSLAALDYPRELIDITVVSDGSTDDTDEIVRRKSDPRIKLLRVPQGGKAAAINAALPKVTGEIVLLTDVRQKLAPDSLKLLVACFADPKVGVVSGHLLLRRGETRNQQNIGLYWRYETWIRDNLSALDSIFGATGPLYAIRSELAVRVPEDVLLDDVYMPLACFFKGYRLIVEPDAVAEDYPTPLRVEFSRKLRTLAGNYQILTHYPALLGPRNRLWFHFVSYKIGRLLMPFALIAAGASSLWIPGIPGLTVLLSQVLFYTLGILDPLIPQGMHVKKYTSIVRTFMAMMVAALGALSVFFVPPRDLWRVTSEAKLPGVPEPASRSVQAGKI